MAGAIPSTKQGFNTQKVQLLKSVEYGRTATGRINTTVMVITFNMMPEFEQDQDPETVYFNINTTWIRSGLPLSVPFGTAQFSVKKSPGELTVNYSPLAEESLIIAGGYNLTITIAGDKWTLTNLAFCKTELCKAWNSSVTGAGKDPFGWENRRTLICDPNNMTLQSNQRTMEITLVADPQYNTKRGENISVQVPAVCSVTGTEKPLGLFDIKVLPQNGYVNFLVSYDGGVTVENLTEISEGALREAKATIYVMTTGDNWDELNAATVSASILDNALAQTYGTFGWNNKKDEMIGENKSNLMKFIPPNPASNITWSFKPVSTFDLAANETVTLNLQGWWMASGRVPIIPTINFTIYASPGVIELVDWIGSNKRVTEDDVRWGRVWFQFRIVGEQWRRDAQPFIQSFSSNDTSATALSALVGSLVPAIQFFNFTVTPDGYEYLRLTLQSQDLYDIDTPENVTLSLKRQTVVSGIQPVFEFTEFVNASSRTNITYIDNSTGNATVKWYWNYTYNPYWHTFRTPNFSFIIWPSPARIFISGAVDGLNEKRMRQSSSTFVYLSLIGDRWFTSTNPNVTQAPYYVRRNISASPLPVTSRNTRGYSLINESILPMSSVEVITSRVMLLKFIPDRRYKLNTTEIIEIAVDSNATVSGLAPYFQRPLRLYVDATGGELRLADDNLVVTERDLRLRPLKFAVAIDGDTINYQQIGGDPRGFLNSALVSASSIIAEPDGFTQNRDEMLHTAEGQEPVMTQGTVLALKNALEVTVNETSNTTNVTTTSAAPGAPPAPVIITTAAPSAVNLTDNKTEPIESSFAFGVFNIRGYNVRNTENWVLTMSDPKFFGTGISADPNKIVLKVHKVPQVMIFLLDQSVSFARTYQTDPLALKTRIATRMALPLDRVITETNKPPFTPDGLLMMRVWFADNSKQGDAGYLSNAFVTDTFTSLTDQFLFDEFAAKNVYFEDNPPANLASGTTTAASKGAAVSSASFVWGIIGAVVILLGAVLFVVGLILQKARLSLSSLRPAGQRQVFESAGKYEDKDVEERLAETTAQVDGRVSKQVESPFFVGRGAKEAQAASNAEQRAARLRQADEEGIQVTQQPMSLREYTRTHLAKSTTGAAAVGLDALGLSPKDIRTTNVTLDEELAGDRDENADMQEKKQMKRDEQSASKYFSVSAAEKRDKIDYHSRRHMHDHTKKIDLLADL